MKKKMMIIAGVCALSLAGCSAQPQNATTSTEQQTEQNMMVEDEDTMETDTKGLPPLEEDLQTLYKDAETVYKNVSLGGIKLDMATTLAKSPYEGYTYYKVDEADYATYDEFKKYLNQYFTMDFIEQEILSESNMRFAQDENGVLYMLDTAKGANILYAGHVFDVVSRTDDTIELDATVYYSAEQGAYTGDMIYEKMGVSDKFMQHHFAFTLVKENDAWKFSRFMLFE